MTVVENTQEAVPEIRTFLYTVQVKFHNTSKSYTFGTDDPTLCAGDRVVVETSQGIELGQCQSSSVSIEKQPVKLILSPVLRKATEEDIQNFEDNFIYAKDALKVCQEEVSDLGLQMRLLSASYLLDRSKILIVYMAEQRVDFRELLKRLGARLHCRIELRQIGDRDKAKMTGGIGICGMECCCTRFKNHFDIISINMAKNQQLALNIEKLSGMCGKLMCCLKFEDDVYKQCIAGLPKLGGNVEYEDELYKVTSINVIANEARIENSETYRILTLDELREKGIIRKGVSVKKAADGQRRSVKVVRSAQIEAKQAETAKEKNKAEVRTFRRENNISNPQEKAPAQPAVNNEPRKQKPEKPQRKEENKQAKEKNEQRRNNNRQKDRNRRRQDNRTDKNANNPNITVRSFKSSKHKDEGQA